MEGSLTTLLERGIRRPLLRTRAITIALVLYAEKLWLNGFAPDASLEPPHSLNAAIFMAERWTARFLLAFALALALFITVRGGQALRALDRRARDARLRPGWLAPHLLLVVALMPLTPALFGAGSLTLSPVPAIALWCACATAALLALFSAMAPLSLWREAFITLGSLPRYAAMLAVLGASAVGWSQRLWDPTARLTFGIVWRVLSPFVPSLHADPDSLVLSTSHFAVEVSRRCSGLEGIGLMLALCGAWLLMFRREYRFPRALLLIPAALVLMFVLNVVRIVALLLVGHAGHPDIASRGFHSQAGWITFNLAGCALLYVSRRSEWLNRAGAHAGGTDTENPTLPYLLPFIAILVAGMAAHAMSSGFERLYGLRPLAALLALAACRRPLTALDWRCSWRGAATGLAVFLLWLVAGHWLLSPALMPPELAALSPQARLLWILGRAGAAIVTVPVAEELAFRGYLLRRLQRADFEAVRFADARSPAMLVSAAVFGLAHGALWLPGIAAGWLYAAVLRRTGRFGEAVVAHATTNALLAGSVLMGGAWQYW